MAQEQSQRWQVGDLVLDVGTQTVVRGNQAIALPQLSFRFLLALVEAAPKVVTVDDMMDRVWAGIFINAETVTQRAKLLRDALGDDPKEPRYFAVRRGVGYQLLPQPILLDSTCTDEAPVALPGTRRSNRQKMVAALTICILAVGAVAFDHVAMRDREAGHERTLGQSAAQIRVAVLPFDNLSADPADAFIARSIPEMVLNRLSLISRLTVIARESAMLSAAAKASPKDAGAQLGAGYVVKGSVQRHGNMLRVTCFIVDTAKGARIWSERFDWPVDRLYTLQDRIADQVAASLESRVGSLGRQKPASGTTAGTDAYLAYLKGKSLLGHFTVAGTMAASEQFERAVKFDPDFAAAQVALFDSRMQSASLRKEDLTPVRAQFQPYLERALQLQPDSGEALFAKAMWMDLPRSERVELFRHAAELDPSNSRGLTAFAEFLEWEDATRDNADRTEGQKLMDRVLSIDPLSPRARFWLVQRQLGKLTPEQLEVEQARELQLAPDNYPLANRYAKRLWMFHGQTADAIAMMERVIASDPQNPWGPHIAVAFYLDANDPAAARAIAASTPATRESSRALLAQYTGDWRTAAEAALGPNGFMFNKFENWNWAEAVRDYALQTGDFDKAAEVIASRYGFDLKHPETSNLPQSSVAPVLGHILLRSKNKDLGTRLLTQTIRWIDQHPRYGIVGVGRSRATAMMLLGQPDQALSTLKAAFESGHDIRHWWYVLERDPVWISMHDDPRFREILEFCRNAAVAQRTKLDALRNTGKVPKRARALQG